MTFVVFGEIVRGRVWAWNGWHSTDEIGLIHAFAFSYNKSLLKIQPKMSFWAPSFAFFTFQSVFCIDVCVSLCVAECSGKAVTGFQPRSVNLAALFSSASDREWGGHRPAVAAPAGPIRRERPWTARRMPIAVCSAVAQIPLWILICSPQCLCRCADHSYACWFR